MFEHWKQMLVVFSVLVALVVWGGWLPGAALVATILLAAGAFAISANQLHPAGYAVLTLVVLVIFPGMIGLLAVVGVLGLVGLAINRLF
ncbi:MAG TPA: hypothetical protein VGG64_04585 [Pirellulales bacterium]|jgi:hypothetical protein